MPLPGGPSEKFGNRYEVWWTVSQLLRIIDGQAESIRIEEPTADKTEFVITANSRQELHQVKRSYTTGKWSLTTLGNEKNKVLQAIFAQLLENPSSQFIFASGSDAPELRELTERARDAINQEEFIAEFAGGISRKNQFKSLKSYWNDADTTTAFEMLQRIEVRTIDEKGIKETIKAKLSVLFLNNPDEICDALYGFVVDSIHIPIERGYLVSFLDRRGFKLRKLAKPNDAPSLISEATDRYLTGTRRKLIQASLIPRSSTQELITSIKGNTNEGVDCVITGKAGGGKTACLIECVETLRTGSRLVTVLAFRLDRIDTVSSTKKLGEDLGLEESPAFVLGSAAESTSGEAILIIDQLDAISRASGRSSEFFDIVDDLLREARGWRNKIKFHVLLVCRKFDWENDHNLRRLLIKEHTHVSVGDFSLDEVKSILHKGDFKTESFSAEQLELLRLPQNMSLFLDITPKPISELKFSSTKELFDHYWDKKSFAVNECVTLSVDHWNDVIQFLCKEMSATQRLLVLKEKLDKFPGEYVYQMTSEGVLSYDDRYYGFGHETFFDYCFARGFVTQEASLSAFLTRSEQHLFRRAQVKQVLDYLRDADRERYCNELRSLLENEDIRFHLKDIACALAVEIPNPEDEEWEVLAPWTKSEIEAIKRGLPNPNKFASLVWNRFFFSQPWFHVADKKGLIEQWLASENDNLVDSTVRYIRFHQRHSGDRIAELLEPFVDRGGNWPQRFNYIMQWADHGNSRRFFDLFLRLIDDGTLDNARGPLATNSTFWDLLHRLDSRLDWVPEVVAHWLSRRLSITRETKDSAGNPVWRDLLSYDGFSSDHIAKSANEFPEQFVQQVLPVVLKMADEAVSQKNKKLPRRDAVWSTLIYRRHNSKEEDLRESIAVALQQLAKINSDCVRKILSELREHDSYIANFFLLQVYTAGAEHFADIAVSELCDKTWRFDCGYSDSPYWIAAQLIKEIASLCSESNRKKLEKAILNYTPDWERTTGGYKVRGEATFDLLSGIPVELRSKDAQARYRELERKFGETVAPPRRLEAHMVVSPIEEPALEKMTDEQWLRAIKKYDQDRSFSLENPEKGGAYELALALKSFVIKEPERFALLSLNFPANINPVYMERTLDGLKETDGYVELKLAVCRKAYSDACHDCGKAIADVLGVIQDKLPDDAVQMLDWLATEHPDPDKELSKEGGSNGQSDYGDILTHGINTTRGRAAESIRNLILRDGSYVARFRSAVEQLANDKSVAVRACVSSTLLAITKYDWEFALAQFARLTEPVGNSCDDPLLSTHDVEHFINFALVDHFGRLQNVIERMLRSTVSETSKAGARLASLAVLYNHNEAESLVDEALQGSSSQRLGVTEVAARNIGLDNCRPWSEQQLLRLFNDSDAKVRQEASTCFRSLETQPFESFENLIKEFCMSAAYSEDSSSILYALEESSHRLPGITHMVCEKFLERFSSEARDISTQRSADVHLVINLILRMYHQHQQDEWGSKCIDLIDQMCLEGIDDIRTNLDEYER